jgi:uncharacterized surface protein with fasciclin (FAS1) repeats
MSLTGRAVKTWWAGITYKDHTPPNPMNLAARVLALLTIALGCAAHEGIAQMTTSLVAGQTAVAKSASATIAEASTKDAPLIQLINEAGLMPVLSGKGPYTFFAPSDAAIQGWSVTDPEQKRQKLLSHVVQGRYTLADLYDGAKLTAMNGETLSILRKKGKVLVNGVPVTSGDISSSNGITHSVSGMLNP